MESFDNATVKPIGVVRLNCEYKNVKSSQDFMIVKEGSMLLGLPGCLALNLIKRIHNVEENSTKGSFVKKNNDVFQGYGKFPNECLTYLPNQVQMKFFGLHLNFPTVF